MIVVSPRRSGVAPAGPAEREASGGAVLQGRTGRRACPAGGARRAKRTAATAIGRRRWSRTGSLMYRCRSAARTAATASTFERWAEQFQAELGEPRPDSRSTSPATTPTRTRSSPTADSQAPEQALDCACGLYRKRPHRLDLTNTHELPRRTTANASRSTSTAPLAPTTSSLSGS